MPNTSHIGDSGRNIPKIPISTVYTSRVPISTTPVIFDNVLNKMFLQAMILLRSHLKIPKTVLTNHHKTLRDMHDFKKYIGRTLFLECLGYDRTFER